jgi:uncharacterized protein (TIGR02145 family)
VLYLRKIDAIFFFMKVKSRISGTLICLFFICFIYSCRKDNTRVPSVVTTDVTDILLTSAVAGGNVTNDGGAELLSKGVCWSSSEEPTIENDKTDEGTGTGSFTSKVINLTPHNLYYLRAYATNLAGTAYGGQVSFVTTGTITDIEGNVYNITTIGTQTWMKENLRATQFSNGTSIPLVTSRLEWYYLSGPGYCWYDNNTNNIRTYGALYNWYTVDSKSNGNKNLCPSGWHVPNEHDWSTLIDFLGGDSIAVGKLKETGEDHWQSPNTLASDETGFTALPGGGRDYNGAFYDMGRFGHWWSSTEFVSGGAWSWFMGYDGSGGYRYGRFEQDGFSVRCIKNE